MKLSTKKRLARAVCAAGSIVKFACLAILVLACVSFLLFCVYFSFFNPFIRAGLLATPIVFVSAFFAIKWFSELCEWAEENRGVVSCSGEPPCVDCEGKHRFPLPRRDGEVVRCRRCGKLAKAIALEVGNAGKLRVANPREDGHE